MSQASQNQDPGAVEIAPVENRNGRGGHRCGVETDSGNHDKKHRPGGLVPPDGDRRHVSEPETGISIVHGSTPNALPPGSPTHGISPDVGILVQTLFAVNIRPQPRRPAAPCRLVGGSQMIIATRRIHK